MKGLGLALLLLGGCSLCRVRGPSAEPVLPVCSSAGGAFVDQSDCVKVVIDPSAQLVASFVAEVLRIVLPAVLSRQE